MNASKTLTALIAAATIAGTASLVVAQTTTDGSLPLSTQPSTSGTLPADSNRSTRPDATLPIDPTRSTLPPQAGAITTPGYSSGATTSYPGNIVTPGSLPSDRSIDRPLPGGVAPRDGTAGNAGSRVNAASGATPSSSETLPRSNRN